ncbi:MAG: histidine phosphatase family protein [Propionibacteriales bacterium]|nr:histidine phosphatase family protein [Propionibacteriales bacterium]
MTETAARRLVVMRHAKTESSAPTDHARELTDRGRRDARAAGAWLGQEGLVPDVVMVSSAVRARSTCDEVCTALGSTPVVRVLDSLYQADEDDVIAACVAEIPAQTQCALVIGHNPTMAMTADLLQADDDRRDVILPTAALAVFAIASEWSDLGPGTGSLQRLHTPQD